LVRAQYGQYDLLKTATNGQLLDSASAVEIHTNSILVDDVLSFGLSGRHACGASRAMEETA
jgi:hypothetical protein